MIVLIGVAGSGKSVQGKLLAQHLNYSWISTGEVLRSSVGESHKEEMLAGKLLDDEEIITVFAGYLDSLGSPQQCILDGFPRTMAQAQWLIKQHQSGYLNLTAVIHLEARQDTVQKRLLTRGRPDDSVAAIKERFIEYERQTLPILDYFKASKIPVYDIDGEKSIDEVQDSIVEALKSN